MRIWARASGSQMCGNCEFRPAEGDPVLLIRCVGVTRYMVRCQDCAGEPVDETQLDVPRQAESIHAAVMQRLAEIMPARFDRKAAQIAEGDE